MRGCDFGAGILMNPFDLHTQWSGVLAAISYMSFSAVIFLINCFQLTKVGKTFMIKSITAEL